MFSHPRRHWRQTPQPERVVVYSRWGCGVCRQCLRGWENICERPAAEVRYHGAGLGRDGGLAEQLVVPAARYLLPIGDLDAAQAAPLADAALTSYHAIVQQRDKLVPGATALVIGVGGLGHAAVQILRALSPARVVAVDRRPEALEVARAAGAHVAIEAGGVPEEVRGAALVLDFVATDETLALAAAAAAPGGAIVYVGRGGGTLGVRAFGVPFDTPVTVSTWGTLPELAEVVALARAGVLHMETQRYALSSAVDGYADLAHGRIIGRAVALN